MEIKYLNQSLSENAKRLHAYKQQGKSAEKKGIHHYHPAFLPFPYQAPIGTKSKESPRPST